MDDLTSLIFKGLRPGDISLLVIIFYSLYKLVNFVATNTIEYFKVKDNESKEEHTQLKSERDAAQASLVQNLNNQIFKLEKRVMALEEENHICEIELAKMRVEIELIKKQSK